MNSKIAAIIFVALSLTFATAANAQQPTGWKAHDNNRPAPKVVDPGEADSDNARPSDAIVLFDGNDLSQWEGPGGREPKWKVNDGVLECFKGAKYLYTKEKFGDVQLHIEWASPTEAKGDGQARGNSGVFLPGGVEIQVLDSFENETYSDGGAASIYGQHPPLVNACRGPGQWQTYDIIYKMPRFDDEGKLKKGAVVTVLQNGVVVQNASEALGPTEWVHHKEFDPSVTEGAIGLQDHGNPVRFRNIWVRKLDTKKTSGEYPEQRAFTAEELERFPGKYQKNLDVKAEDGTLWLKVRNQYIEMAAYEDGTFGTVESAGTISFDSDDDGNVESMEYNFDAGFRGSAKRK